MRQRALSPAGDFTFGLGLPLLQDTPACVAQAIMTRLRLRTGEWFMDSLDGTPYDGSILGHSTGGTRDLALQARILDTPGVLSIEQYASYVTAGRDMTVSAIVGTQYGPAAVSTTL